MSHLVILLALFMGDPSGTTAITRTMTAQECAQFNNQVSDDNTGVRMFLTCETLDSANDKLQRENCKPVALDSNMVTYRCED